MSAEENRSEILQKKESQYNDITVQTENDLPVQEQVEKKEESNKEPLIVINDQNISNSANKQNKRNLFVVTSHVQNENENNNPDVSQLDRTQDNNTSYEQRQSRHNAFQNVRGPISTKNNSNSNKYPQNGRQNVSSESRTVQRGNSRNSQSIGLNYITPHQASQQGNQQVKEFYAVKQDRAIKEKNAELLANRIALLKQEQMTILKKIEETRKQALDIYYIKLQKEDQNNQQNGEMMRMEREKEQRKREAERKYNEKKLQEEENKQQLDKIKQEQKEQAKQIKQQSQKIAQLIEKNKQSMLKNSIARRQEIKDKEQVGKEKVYEFYQQKRDQYKSQIEFNKYIEMKKKNDKEEEIRNMEEYQAELISRLQNTQLIQREAYDELQSALKMHPKDFSTRFLATGEVQSTGEITNREQFNNDNNISVMNKRNNEISSTTN